MALLSFIYSGVSYDTPAASTTTLNLLTDPGGAPIPYLERSHVKLYSTVDDGDTLTLMSRPSEWDFNTEGTQVVLVTPADGSTSYTIRRETPLDSAYVTFSSGRLSPEQLNQSALFSLYILQEYLDGAGGGAVVDLLALTARVATNEGDIDDLEADGSVTTAKIADEAVTSAKIGNSAVTGTRLASNAVSEGKLGTNAVTTAKIADGAVTSDKIADGAVTSAKIPADAVGSSQLATSAVSTGKINTAAVTTNKIADLAVTEGKLADSAVATAKIEDAAVTGAKVEADVTLPGDPSSSGSFTVGESGGAGGQLLVRPDGSSNVVIGMISQTLGTTLGRLVRYSTGPLEISTTDGGGKEIWLDGNNFRMVGMNVIESPLGRLQLQHDVATEVMSLRATGVGAGASLFFAYQGSGFIGLLTSDSRLKALLPEPASGLDMLAQLQPRYFEFTGHPTLSTPEGARWGYFAQDLEPHFPTMVKEVEEPPRPDGGEVTEGLLGAPVKGLTDDTTAQLCAILTKALQEAVAKIDALEERLTALEGS